MQPDFKLCGQILKKLKDAERLAGPNAIVRIDGVDHATVSQHMQLLYDAGLVSAITTDGRRTLTIAANKFLRNGTRPDCWAKTKRSWSGLDEDVFFRMMLEGLSRAAVEIILAD